MRVWFVIVWTLTPVVAALPASLLVVVVVFVVVVDVDGGGGQRCAGTANGRGSNA